MHMSGGMTPVRRQGSREQRLSTLQAASAAVADNSGTSGKAGDAGDLAPARKGGLYKAYEKGAEYFTNLFPVWLTLFSLVALKDPSMFAWFTTE